MSTDPDTMRSKLRALKVSQSIVIRVTRDDIMRSKCGDRHRCIIANALRRTFCLPNDTYVVRVDANRTFIHLDDSEEGSPDSWELSTPSMGMKVLRLFDKMGLEEGEEAARSAAEPFDLKFTLLKAYRKRKLSDQQRANVKKAQAKYIKKLRATGKLVPTKHYRYAGI